MICIELFAVNSGPSFAVWLAENSYCWEGSASAFLLYSEAKQGASWMNSVLSAKTVGNVGAV